LRYPLNPVPLNQTSAEISTITTTSVTSTVITIGFLVFFHREQSLAITESSCYSRHASHVKQKATFSLLHLSRKWRRLFHFLRHGSNECNGFTWPFSSEKASDEISHDLSIVQAVTEHSSQNEPCLSIRNRLIHVPES